jgi:hypothetical protein
MNVAKILAALRQEREQIEEAILSMAQTGEKPRGRQRGRPPAWMANPPKKLGRPPGSKNKTSANSMAE